MNYIFTSKIIKEQLQKEEKDSLMWQKIIDSNKDEISVRQAKTNISSNLHRIEELKKVLEIINDKK